MSDHTCQRTSSTGLNRWPRFTTESTVADPATPIPGFLVAGGEQEDVRQLFDPFSSLLKRCDERGLNRRKSSCSPRATRKWREHPKITRQCLHLSRNGHDRQQALSRDRSRLLENSQLAQRVSGGRRIRRYQENKKMTGLDLTANFSVIGFAALQPVTVEKAVNLPRIRARSRRAGGSSPECARSEASGVGTTGS